MANLPIDFDQANDHLDVLAPRGTAHIFALLPEAPGSTPRPRHLYGTLSEVRDAIEHAQRIGCGAYVAVNQMRRDIRRRNEVRLVRAIWIERDQPGPRLPLPASLRVRTSPGRGHDYLLVDPAHRPTPEEAERINRQIATEYGGDRQACDLPRVLRLAGTRHLKGEPHRCEIIAGNGRRYTRTELLAAFPAPPPSPRPPTPVRADIPSLDRLDRYRAGTVRGVLTDLSGASEGRRNHALNSAAFRLGQLGIGVDEAAALLAPTAIDLGLGQQEVARTIASGVTAGAQHPRLAAGRAA